MSEILPSRRKLGSPQHRGPENVGIKRHLAPDVSNDKGIRHYESKFGTLIRPGHRELRFYGWNPSAIHLANNSMRD
jgi:hypothetical protein